MLLQVRAIDGSALTGITAIDVVAQDQLYWLIV